MTTIAAKFKRALRSNTSTWSDMSWRQALLRDLTTDLSKLPLPGRKPTTTSRVSYLSHSPQPVAVWPQASRHSA